MKTKSLSQVLLSLLTLAALWIGASVSLGADVTDYVSRWTFDNSGALGADSGPGANTGVGTNATYTAAGQIAGAVSFVGNGVVMVPYSSGLNLSAPFSLSAWVKIAATPGSYGIMGTRFSGDTTFDFKVTGNSIHGDFGNGSSWINTGVDIGSGDTGTNGQGGQLTISKWYMITYVVDTAAFRLYIDGDLKKTIAFSGTPLLMKSGETLGIGECSGGEYMNGVIDDARIYNRALSTAEVLSVHNAGIVIPPIAFLANPFTVTRATAGQPYVGSVATTTNDNIAGDAVFSKTSGPAWINIAANGAVTGTPAAGDVGGPFAVGVHAVSTGNSTTADAVMNISVGDGLVTTKILFIQGRNSNSLAAYKYFIANTVYPNANIIFSGDTLADKSYFVSTPYGALNPAQLARLNDADLIIITPDINSADYQTPDWGQLNVPMLLHSANLSADAIGTGWGWISGYFENSAAMPSHSAGVSDGMAGDKWYGHEQWSSDSFFTGMTGHFVAANPDGSGDIAANWFPLFNSAGYAMGGSINSDSWGQGTILFSGNGSTQYNDKSFIVRWAQGNRLGRSGTTAASRRFGFNMGANNNYDAINGFLSPLTGANANGLLALQHAFQYLYNPANGRRPIPNAGANKTLYIIPPATAVDLNVNDATYTDGNGGTAGTLAWTLKAVNPVLEGTESITAGAATLTPTFHFTSPGVFTATLRATNPPLDYVESTKTITVSTPTVPYIVSVSPPNGRVVPNLTGPVIVQFDHNIAFTPPLMLTVNNGGGPVVINGSTADNITFSFDCSSVPLSGTNTSISFSLNTSTVKDGIGGVLPFATPTYTWALIYNVLGPRPIVLCSNRTGASNTAYVALLTSLYGVGTPITVWSGVNYTASPWSAATSGTLQNASLVILDDNNAYNDAQWRFLRAPLMTNNSGFCKASNHMMAPTDNNWPSQTDIRAENYWNNPFFEGVSVREDNDCVIALANTQLMNLEYAAGTGLDSFDPNQVPYGMSLGYYRGGDFNRKNGMFWPKKTRFYSGSTQTAQGRRLYALSAGNGSNMWATNQLSPNGVQFAINLHKYFARPSGAPDVVWKDPAAKLAQKMTTVTIRFDRTVSAPTGANMLTIKDQSNATIGTYGPAVAAPGGDGMVWTFDTSAANMVGRVAQTFHFSVAMTGVVETESLYNIPFQGAAYTWDTAYDPLGYNQILFIGDRPNSTKEIPAYAAWLTNNYGPNQSYRFMEPTAFGAAVWSTSTLKAINDAKLIVMLASGNGGYTDAGYMGHFINSAQWNTVTNNMLILATGGPLAPNWGCTTTQNNWGLASLSVANALPALFKGTTVSSNQVTLFTGNLATRRLNFGTAAAPTFNGINYGFVRPGDGTSYVWLHEWLAGTIYAQGGTAFPAGRRLFYAVDNEDADSLFTNNLLATDGLTIFKNAFYYYDPPATPPTIVSATPANQALYVQAAPAQVMVTFNAPVAGVGALTVAGVSAGLPTTTDNLTFTWTPTSLPNVTATVALSVDTSAVHEIASGLNVPSSTATYAWSFTYDQNQYHPRVTLISNPDGQENHSAYVSFLINDVYATTRYRRSIVIEDVPGKYYNMTAAGKTALESASALSVVMPYQVTSSLTRAMWNTVNQPMLVHSSSLVSNSVWDWGSTLRTFSSTGDNLGVSSLSQPALGTTGYFTLLTAVLDIDPLIQGTEIVVSGGMRNINYWNSTPLIQCVENRLGQGTPYQNSFRQPIAKWSAGQNIDLAATTALTNRVYQSIGMGTATDVTSFFDPVTGARDLGAKQVTRNALRYLFNPDSLPFPLVVQSATPSMNGSSGVLGPISVTFNKPANGVQAHDLTWKANSSGITYQPTAVVPQGSAPSSTWIFDGPWETDNSLIGQFQTISITLNGMDSLVHSHIVGTTGDGCPPAAWTWNYVWTPVPAAAPSKVWMLYE